MWDNVGMGRNEAGLKDGARADPAACARSSGRTSRCRATGDELNQVLEYAGRVADYLEFGELHGPRRARPRASRAAGTSARSTRRPTARRCATTRSSPTWRRGSTRATAALPIRNVEPLTFEYVKPSQRSYK